MRRRTLAADYRQALLAYASLRLTRPRVGSSETRSCGAATLTRAVQLRDGPPRSHQGGRRPLPKNDYFGGIRRFCPG